MYELDFQVAHTPATFDVNFGEIKQALEEQMRVYKELELTEEAIPERKSDVALLRKMRGAIDTRRKEIKAEFNKPYAEFEAKVKELISLIDEPIELIDTALKEFDAKRIAERQDHLRELYNDNIKGYAHILPFETLKGKSWDNKTKSDKDIIDEIQIAVISVENDLLAIRNMGSPIEDELIGMYEKTRNLPAVIKRAADFLKDRELIEKAEEESRKAAEEREEEIIATKPEPTVAPVFHTEPPARQGYVNFRVSVLDAGLTEELLNENDISFDREDL